MHCKKWRFIFNLTLNYAQFNIHSTRRAVSNFLPKEMEFSSVVKKGNKYSIFILGLLESSAQVAHNSYIRASKEEYLVDFQVEMLS